MSSTETPEHKHPDYLPVVMVTEKKYVSTIRGLAITQIIFGSLILVMSHVSYMILYVQNLLGIEPLGGVAGLWIVLTGIMGLLSFKQEKHYCLNGTYLGFCIFSSILALINVFFFSIRVINLKNGFYGRYEDTGPSQALAGVVLFISGCEFCVSLAASICCCIYQLCCPRQAFKAQEDQLLVRPYNENVVDRYGTTTFVDGNAFLQRDQQNPQMHGYNACCSHSQINPPQHVPISRQQMPSPQVQQAHQFQPVDPHQPTTSNIQYADVKQNMAI